MMQKILMQCFFRYRIFLSLDLLLCPISSEVHFSVVAIPHLDLLSVQPCQQVFLLKTETEVLVFAPAQSWCVHS